MNYEDAKAIQTKLDAEVSEASEALQHFPRGNMGLVPDAVRATAEWQSAKRLFDARFKRLREYNSIYVKKFAKEIRAERRERRG